jgi:hypothetical protein
LEAVLDEVGHFTISVALCCAMFLQ